MANMLQGNFSIGKLKIPKAGVVLGGAIAVGIVGYAYYTRRNNSGSTETIDLSNGDPSIDPETGLPYADEFGGGVSSGLSYYDPASGQTIGTGVGGQIITSVSTNAAWSQAASATLLAFGYEGTAIAAALGKVLTGQPVTTDELAIFNAARGLQGEPPQTYPPIHMATSTTPPPSTAKTVTAPGGLKVTHIDRTYVDIDWNPVTNATGYKIYVNGASKTSSLFTQHRVTRLSPNKSYRISVAAVIVDPTGPGSADTIGPQSSVSVKTKR